MFKLLLGSKDTRKMTIFGSIATFQLLVSSMTDISRNMGVFNFLLIWSQHYYFQWHSCLSSARTDSSWASLPSSYSIASRSISHLHSRSQSTESCEKIEISIGEYLPSGNHLLYLLLRWKFWVSRVLCNIGKWYDTLYLSFFRLAPIRWAQLLLTM